MDVYEKTAAVLKALSHPVRLQILLLLAEEGEACVCHLEARLGQRQAYISQQLAKLREAGLVEDQRDGLNVFYSLSVEDVDTLVEEAKDLARIVALAEGTRLEFAEPHKVEPSECVCPRCAQKLALTEPKANRHG